MALIKPKELVLDLNKLTINPQTLTEGFSQSEMCVWDECAEKWFLGYNHRFRRKGKFVMHFIYGDAVHAALEDFYKTSKMKVASLQEFLPSDVIPTNEEQFDLEMWNGILQIQMERYALRYQDDLTVWVPWAIEEQIKLEFEGVLFRGKIDLGVMSNVDESFFLSDHKTWGFDDYEGWQFRFQFMFYWWLAQKATGKKITKFLVNGIKKPALRLGKKESLPSFLVRIKQDHIQTPDKYFIRHWLHSIKNSMEHFEERVLRPKLNRIKLLTQGSEYGILLESLVRNQNTNACVKFGKCCEFLPICKHGIKKESMFYTQRPNKHVELE